MRFGEPWRAAFGTPALTLVVALSVGAGCGDDGVAHKPGSDAGVLPDADGVSDAGPAGSYAIVVLPDTQFYASSWPDIFAAQTRWIVDNRQAEGIAFVLHTGDIVDSDNIPDQWVVASRSLHALDNQVPYVITAGNHDYTGMLADRVGMASSHFPVSGFAAFSWFGGTFEADHIENSYSVFNVGARRMAGDRARVRAA